MPGENAQRPLRVARLVRVSTAHIEQADSPQHQLAFLDTEIRREGWLDTGLVYAAELTGVIIMDRADIQRLLADAGAGRFDAVVLKSISRLGRDTLGLLMVKRMLDDLRIELIAVADGYRSTRDPELIFLIHAERAQAGRQEISKNVRAGIVQAARRGIWPAGTLPFGLRKEGRFAIGVDPETGPLVQLIFALRCRHWGLVRICKHLHTDLQVRAPRWWHLREQIRRLEAAGGAGHDERIRQRLERLKARLLTEPFAWSPRTVRLILANTAYCGELRYNRTTGQRRLHGRLVRESRDPSDWVTLPCPPLVTRSEWESAQAAGAVRARLPRRSLGSCWLLSGLVVCGRCGYALRAQPARCNTGRRGGEPRGYYVCRGSLESGTHPPEYIKATALEGAVLHALRGELAGIAAPEVGRKRSRGGRDAAGDRDRLLLQLRDLAEARYFRREAVRKGQMTPAEFEFELALIQKQEAELRRRLGQQGQAAAQAEAEAEAQAQAQAQAEERRRQAVQEAVQRLVRLEGPEAALKTLLPTLVRKVIVHSAQLAEIHTTFAREAEE